MKEKIWRWKRWRGRELFICKKSGYPSDIWTERWTNFGPTCSNLRDVSYLFPWKSLLLRTAKMITMKQYHCQADPHKLRVWCWSICLSVPKEIREQITVWIIYDFLFFSTPIIIVCCMHRNERKLQRNCILENIRQEIYAIIGVRVNG